MNGRRRGEVGFFPTRNRTPEPYLKADHILIILGGQSHLEKRLVATPCFETIYFYSIAIPLRRAGIGCRQ